MDDDVEARQELLGRIRARRASINKYVREKRPLGNRLANISIVSSAIAAALTAGPAAGGVTFAETVQKGLGWGELSSVWRLLCLAALIVSLVAAISANLNKSNDLTARISTAEACNADLEGLHALVEFGELPTSDAVTVYRQLVTKIPFVEEDLAAGVNADSNGGVPAAPGAPLPSPVSDLAQQWRSPAIFPPATAIVVAGLVLLATVIGLFLGLNRGDAAASPSHPPPSSTTTDASPAPNSVAPTISVGARPVGMAVTRHDRHAYVTNSGSHNVSVIDTTSSTVTDTIPVGTAPVGVATTPDGRHAYIPNRGANNVSVIDTTSNTVTDTITVGTSPQAVAVTPDGRHAYITNLDSNTVSVIDTMSNTVTDTITVGTSPQGVTVTPDGRHVYVPSSDANNVSVIDTMSNTITDTITVGTDPLVVAVTPDGRHAYVPNRGSNNVSVIDTTSNTVIDTITVGTSPQAVAVAPDGRHAYITNRGANNVSVIDTTSNTVIDTITVGTDPIWVTVTPDGRHAYILNYGGNNVSMLNIGSKE